MPGKQGGFKKPGRVSHQDKIFAPSAYVPPYQIALLKVEIASVAQGCS
jgi:hypothetical protein